MEVRIARTTRWVRILAALFVFSSFACGSDPTPDPGTGGTGGTLADGGTGGGGEGGEGGMGGVGGDGGMAGAGGDGGHGGAGGEGGGPQEPVCGDGVREGDEACDDGEDNSDTRPDACREDCTLPRCGDGVLDSNEACLLGSSTACLEIGPYHDGVATCDESCQWDVGSCWSKDACVIGKRDDGGDLIDCDDPRCAADLALCPVCGDGLVTGEETCDGTKLEGATCRTLGFGKGTLACADDCRSFDTTSCDPCGNGRKEEGEDCDLYDLGGATCTSLGFDAGQLSCAAGCSYDTASCRYVTCGDGFLDQGEDCEGTNLGGTTCLDLGHQGGYLTCGAGCVFDQSQCTDFPTSPTCGDGILDPLETCDDGNLTSGDGCGPICLRETGVCGATIVDLNTEFTPHPDGYLTYWGTLAGATNTTEVSCSVGVGPDRTHAHWVGERSWVHFMVESLDAKIGASIRSHCGDASTERDCFDDGDTVAKVEWEDVPAGTQLYLVVDSSALTAGTYVIDAYVLPIRVQGEACDSSVMCEQGLKCSQSGICSICPNIGPCP
jgi:cysteine-rich repeat protein